MKQHISLLLLGIIMAVCVGLGLCSGCSSDADDLYAHERAFLKFKPVSAVGILHNAVNSPGQFCRITVNEKTFEFASAEGKSMSYPLSAEIQTYGKPQCIAGFVIGISLQPDMNLQYPVLAFDLVCPACYTEAFIQRSLAFADGQMLSCPRCHRTYDLTNNGVGSDGKYRLYRYHVTYSSANDLLVVLN